MGGFVVMLLVGEFLLGIVSVVVLVDIVLNMDLVGVSRIYVFMVEWVELGFGLLDEVVDVIVNYNLYWLWFLDLDGLVVNLCCCGDCWYWYWDL